MFESVIDSDRRASEAQLPTISPNAFADFVSYMHSSIYSTNTQVAGYRSLRAHTDACLLAAKLEADKYWAAAMRQLHALFLPLARSRRSDAKQSFIRASDIDYVCANTAVENLRSTVTLEPELFNPLNNIPWGSHYRPPTSPITGAPPPPPRPRREYHSDAHGAMQGLRILFFDALASHWTQYDVASIGAPDSPRGGGNNKNDVPGDTTTWQQVRDTYPEFRDRLASTIGHGVGWRSSLLRRVNNYLDPVVPELFRRLQGAGNGGSGGSDSDVTLHVEDVDKVEKKEKTEGVRVTVEEVDDDGEFEMEKATRRPKLTLSTTGLRGTGTTEQQPLEEGEIDESEKGEEWTLVDAETKGKAEAPGVGETQDEEMEGMDAGIEEEEKKKKNSTSAGA
jgi:hypothetical protein